MFRDHLIIAIAQGQEKGEKNPSKVSKVNPRPKLKVNLPIHFLEKLTTKGSIKVETNVPLFKFSK